MLTITLAAATVAAATPPADRARSSPPADVLANAVDPEEHFVPGELLVKLVATPSVEAVRQAKRRVKARTVKAFPSIGVELWTIDRKLPVDRAIQRLAGADLAGAIAYVEPNYIWRAGDLTNDPMLGEQWGLHNVGQSGGTADADIDAPEAWGVHTGSSEVVVGVIDTGIDYDHVDLAANIWSNPGEVENGLDDDGNGYVDDVRGWDFVNDDNDPWDDHYHGTHTGGTVGAVGNNGVGVTGVCWDVTLMPLKFLDGGGRGSTDDAIDAILYAASFTDESGNPIVRITSNSWGGGHRSRALEDAIAISGALFVASAGNSGNSRKNYPAAYSLDNIIAVAATDGNDQLASFSSFGAQWVHLGAPGVAILSTRPNDTYGNLNGTSMAAPHVSGVAALLMAADPSLTNGEVKMQILATVDPLDSLAGVTTTGGRLNAAAALGAGGGTPPPVDTTPPETVATLEIDPGATTSESITVSWLAPGEDGAGSGGAAFLYDVRYSTGAIFQDEDFDAATEASGEPAPQSPGSVETFTIAGLQRDTSYCIALKSMDDAGNVSALSNVVFEVTLTPEPSAWQIETIDTGPSMGTYLGLDFDSGGNPAAAYSDYGNDRIKFSRRTAAGWSTPEIVDASEYAGVDFAFDPVGDVPTVSYGWGKLYFATRSESGAWNRLNLQPNARNDVTSLVYDPSGDPGISFRAGGGNDGLNIARRIDGAWTVQNIHSGAGARYNALAYDASGSPAIAYSDDPDGDGWLSALVLARWLDGGWVIETVDEGSVGYGVFAAIAFDPVSQTFAMLHDGADEARFITWNGSEWVVEPLEQSASSVSGCGLAFGPDGTAHAAWGAGGVLKYATRPPDAPEWTIEDVGPGSGFHLPLVLDDSVPPVPAILYRSGNEIRLARRNGPGAP
jgi:subtilisin family serine protease